MDAELVVAGFAIALLIGLVVGFRSGRRHGMCEILGAMSRPDSQRSK